MSSFFTRPASLSKKRKRAPATAAPLKKAKPQPPQDSDDASLSGSESSGSSKRAVTPSSSESEDDEDQTEASRRLKLAEQYLDNIRRDVAADQNLDPEAFDAAEIDKDIVAKRVKQDVAEGHGRVYKRIAANIDFQKAQSVRFQWGGLSTVGVAVEGTGKFAWTASKDGVICKWILHSLPSNSEGQELDVTTPRRKPKQMIYKKGGDKRRTGDFHYKHHTAEIYCIAASHDGRFVATGGADKRLIIWSGDTLKPLKVFTHHRDAVMSVTFRGKTNQLFSAGKDRTVKIWSLDELAYVETLFGHQDEVLDVAAVGDAQERCVSVGGRDRTARLWKVVEESQLVFRGGGLASIGKHDEPTGDAQIDSESNNAAQMMAPRVPEQSLDRVLQIDTQLFVTGSDNGSLSLYSLHKKKPLHVLPLAHGYDPPLPASRSWSEVNAPDRKTNAEPTPRYITAIAGIPFSDLFVTGSWDGDVRVWRLNEDLKNIERLGVVSSEPIRSHQSFDDEDKTGNPRLQGHGLSRGIVNDLKVFERGERGQDGIGIVAAVGKEMRCGRWLVKPSKNGAIYFEIPKSNG